MFGYSSGHIYQETSSSPKEKTYYRISAYGTRAYEVITLVKPFLRIKAKQADTVMEYYEWRMALGWRGLGVALSEEEALKRKSFYVRMRELNRRGSNAKNEDLQTLRLVGF